MFKVSKHRALWYLIQGQVFIKNWLFFYETLIKWMIWFKHIIQLTPSLNHETFSSYVRFEIKIVRWHFFPK